MLTCFFFLLSPPSRFQTKTKKQVVRRLTSEREEFERLEAEGSSSSELQSALKQIEKMREQRQRQQVMVQGIVKQRDMYRKQCDRYRQMIHGDGQGLFHQNGTVQDLTVGTNVDQNKLM